MFEVFFYQSDTSMDFFLAVVVSLDHRKSELIKFLDLMSTRQEDRK